jgi:hypothetical protein
METGSAQSRRAYRWRPWLKAPIIAFAVLLEQSMLRQKSDPSGLVETAWFAIRATAKTSLMPSSSARYGLDTH